MIAKDIIAKGYGLLTKNSNDQFIGFDGIYKADARIEEKISRSATVTNFYVEDGTSAADHIITDAISLTITGEVGKVIYQRNFLMDGYLKARDQLGNISIYLPNKTNSQISKISKIVNKSTNVIRKIEDVSNKIKQIGDYAENTLGLEGLSQYTDINKITGNKKVKDNETAFYEFVENYMQNKKLMKLETAKYGILDDMAIVNYSLSSTDNTHSSYTMDLQQIRKVKTLITPIKKIARNASGSQSGTQTQDKQDKGVVQGKPKSLLSKIFS